MAEKFKKWTCFLCGDTVIEGQRFVWMPDRGYAHIECLHEVLRDKFNGAIPADVEALVDLDEVIAYAIVRSKQVEKLLDEETRAKVEEARHKLEGLSALASRLLKDKLDNYNVEV